MGKHDALLNKIREVHANLVESFDEVHKIESRFSDMTTQISSLTRMKKDLDAKIMGSLKVLVNRSASTSSQVPEAANLHKHLQQLLKVEDGLGKLGSQEMVNRVAADGRRLAAGRQRTWYELMEDLVDKAKSALAKEEDKALRDGMRKVDWKKIKFGYSEPPLKK